MITRRNFIKKSTITATGFLVVLGNTKKKVRASALEGVAVAGIGVGGKGNGDIQQAGFYGKVVALCDVDRNTLASAKKAFRDSQTFVDFREMFAEMGDKIDACTISTSDHMHSPQTAMAMKLGKHVYTQKPLTRTVGEARYLTNLAKSTGVCTQMGTQGSSDNGLRMQAAQIRAGILGEVTEIHIWTNRPIWPQGPNRNMTLTKFKEEMAKEDADIAEDEIREKTKQIESGLRKIAWDSWVGVAPEREFWPSLYHPFSWRGWWDFGTGSLGDIGCHSFNMSFKACDLRYPTSIVATSSGHDFNSFPASSIVYFDVPANDRRGPIKYVWYDARQTPPQEWADRYGFKPFGGDGGTLVIGEKGAFCNGSYNAVGGTKLELIKNVDCPFAPVDEDHPDGDSRHKFEWFNAIWENNPSRCWSNFVDQAGPLTECVLVGNLAVWAASNANEPGEKIEWDGENLKITNIADLKTPGLEQLVRPIYREGYEQI